ncbi:DnaJ domain-containing protein [Synechococcales cyanobacterium C]|uniref:DnaJ domain-containing protein n=1 Tax=Petrachloros mirabilis ULC683 TaxID=2781853 RepID=A0A8K2A0Y1_9CYAN|nr:DnaJ domain-containing protein [Petrachloros mirabilis]NCJ08463.1 DnaJ domain-containing protein [Petrachloros mirabilis ULC683]
MQDYYDQLGIAPGATLAEIKAAYHAKLKAFPAHSYPQEFKAIRAAYEALRQGDRGQEDFFEPRPIDVKLDESLLSQLHQKAMAAANVSLKDLITLTF